MRAQCRESIPYSLLLAAVQEGGPNAKFDAWVLRNVDGLYTTVKLKIGQTNHCESQAAEDHLW